MTDVLLDPRDLVTEFDSGLDFFPGDLDARSAAYLAALRDSLTRPSPRSGEAARAASDLAAALAGPLTPDDLPRLKEATRAFLAAERAWAAARVAALPAIGVRHSG